MGDMTRVRRREPVARVSVVALIFAAAACGGSNSKDGDGSGSNASNSNESSANASSSNGTSSSSGGMSNSATSSNSGGASSSSGGASGEGGDSGTPIVCGDLTCSAAETCDGCAADCGECEEPPVTECNDGIDNDDDGLVDWQYDVGCWSELDTTEASGSRAEENGFTTFDLSDDSLVVYVSQSDGDDANDGLSPETAVATPTRGAEIVRDGSADFLLFKRGDTWRQMPFGDRVANRFKSGLDAEHPMVVSSYGDSTERPRFEVDTHFIDDDGNERSYLAVVGLAFVSFRLDPDDADFNGADAGALRFVGTGHDILIEDNYVEYGEFIIQNVSQVAVRRNVVYRSYHVGTCAYDGDGNLDPNGDSTYRPSGIFGGSVDGLVIEGNVFDENGWNPDVAEACATIYNHDLYISGCNDLVVRDNLVLRASSIGLKMAANETGASNDILIENNLFAEGEIGISMGGNGDTEYRFSRAIVRDNVFTDIGRSQPTTRTLTWYVDLSDNDDTEVFGNLLVNQPDLGNPYGFRVGGASSRNVRISDNLAYGLGRRNVLVEAQNGWDSVTIDDNNFVSQSSDGCLVQHEGGFESVSYSGNAYSSEAAADTWFCVDGDRYSLSDWVSQSGESDATESEWTAPEPDRNLDSYADHLSIGSSLAEFAASARLQSRHRYRPELTAANANNYIREGFGLSPR